MHKLQGLAGLKSSMNRVLNAVEAPVLTSAPIVSGTPNPGQTLTVTAGLWADAASVQRDLLDGSTAIAAGIPDGHTHVMAHGESIVVREVATHSQGGQATSFSNTLDVVYAPPQTTGSIADQTFTVSTGAQVVAAGGAITTEDPAPAYSLIEGFGSGRAIDAETGDVTVFTGGSGVLTDVTVTVRLTDADGQTADVSFLLNVEQVPAPVFTTQPTLDLAAYTVGDTVTLTEGVADGGATLAIDYFRLDGVDKSGELSGLTWDTTGEAAGTISYRVSATNAGGTTFSDEITATLSIAAGATTLSIDEPAYDGVIYDVNRASAMNIQNRVRNNAKRTVTTDKVWGVDAAPTGVTVVNSAVTVDTDVCTGFTGWEINGLSLHYIGNWTAMSAAGDNRVNVTEADLPMVAPQSHYVFVELTQPTSIIFTDHEVNGPNTYAVQSDTAGFAAPSNAFRIGGPGTGTGYADTGSIIRRLKCFGVTADGLKFFGKNAVVEDCAFVWEANTPAGTAPYDETLTYMTNAYALNGSGHLFRAKVNGITGAGNAPPTTKVSDAQWESLDPHMDGENPFASMGGNLFSRIFISMRAAPGRVLVGANNGIRAVADNSGNPLLSDIYQHHVIDRDRTVSSRSIQHDRNGATNVAPSVFVDNWISEHSGGQLLYIPDADFMPIWVGNRNLDTGLVQNDHPTLTIVDRFSEFETARVPVTGTTDALDGETIEARVVLASDSSEVHPWADVATVAGGAFSGEVEASPGPSMAFYRVEARVKSAPAAAAAMTDRFRCGLVGMHWGQSEGSRSYLPSYSNVTTPTVSDGTLTTVTTSNEQTDATVAQNVFVSDATPLTAATATMANEFAAIAPGYPVHVIEALHSGTSFEDTLDESNLDRLMANTLNVMAEAGTTPGLVLWSWSAADGNKNDKYAGAFFPGFSKMEEDGTPFVLGSTHTFASFSFPIDHCLWDLVDGTEGIFDADRTKLMMFGPHQFDPGEDLLNANTRIDTTTFTNLDNKEKVRTSWRSMIENPLLEQIMLPMGPEMIGYLNGRDDLAGGWEDNPHPSDESMDGLPLRQQMFAHAFAHGMGLSPHIPPELNRRYEDPNGAFVEFWYEAPDGSTPPITTKRLLRGEPALPATFPHWTEVTGFEINAAPAQNVSIVAGRIRVYPPTGDFSSIENNAIKFGPGGASGYVKHPEDPQNNLHLNWPVIVPANGLIEGIAVRPMPDPDVLNLTRVPAGAAATFTTAATGPYFEDATQIGAGVTGITGEIRMQPTAGNSGYCDVFQVSGSRLKFEWDFSDGDCRYQMANAANVDLVNTTASGVLPTAGMHTITVSANQDIGDGNGFFKVFVDGVEVISHTFTGGDEFTSNRYLRFLENNANLFGQVEYLRVWKEATSDGTLPLSAPYEEIVGPTAAANAHPWKTGDNAT